MTSRISVSDEYLERQLELVAGTRGSIDVGPGPMMNVFGRPVQSRIEFNLWDYAEEAGIDDATLHEVIENAIWEHFSDQKSTILAVIAHQKELRRGLLTTRL